MVNEAASITGEYSITEDENLDVKRLTRAINYALREQSASSQLELLSTILQFSGLIPMGQIFFE